MSAVPTPSTHASPEGTCIVSLAGGADPCLLTEALLLSIFGPLGALRYHVSKDFTTGNPHGEGFVTFANPAAARRAARITHGIRVGVASSSSSSSSAAAAADAAAASDPSATSAAAPSGSVASAAAASAAASAAGCESAAVDGCTAGPESVMVSLNVRGVGAAHDPKKVIVVGAGLAGASAALAAAEAGADVVVLDKTRGGGNSAKASSGINAAGTEHQAAAGIDDSIELFEADTRASGKGRDDPKLVRKLVGDSAEALAWLSDKSGMVFDAAVACGGHSAARTHRAAPVEGAKPVNVGWGIMKPMLDALRSSPNISLVTGATVNSLASSSGRVTGVCCTLEDGTVTHFDADAVVLACGGYGASSKILAEAVPALAGFPTTNGEFATGDGLALAAGVGGLVSNLDAVQVHPTGFVNPADPTAKTKFLAPEALRGYGGVLLNPADGAPVCDPLATRDVVSSAIGEVCGPVAGANSSVALLLMPESVRTGFNPGVFGFYVFKGLITTHESTAAAAAAVAELVGDAACPGGADALAAAFAAALPSDHDPAAPVHTALVTPSVHYTMGGVAINPRGQVIRASSSQSIPGLYAAGEVTTGVHGSNRLAGNSLAECVVFGRSAGTAAALDPLELPALNPSSWTPLALQSVTPVSSSTSLFRFALPSKSHASGLGLGQYLKVRPTSNHEMIRYYSPISRNDAMGTLDLCVKVSGGGVGDDPASMAGQFKAMAIGDLLEFQGPAGGPEINLAYGGKTKFGLLAGGTGIAPMIQIMRAALLRIRKMGSAAAAGIEDVTLMYAAKNEEEILIRESLERHAANHPDVVSLFYALMEPPPEWSMGVGFITADMMAANLPPPGDDTLIIVCGPPPFCNAMRKAASTIGYVEGRDFYSYL